MRYEFIKKIYELTEYSNEANKRTWKSLELSKNNNKFVNAVKDNKLMIKMGYSKMRQDYLKKWKGDLEYISKNCIEDNGAWMARDGAKVMDHFSEYNPKPVEMSECFNIYFLILENHLYPDNYKNNGRGLFEYVLRAAGHNLDLSIFPLVQDAITGYVIRTNQNADVWIALLCDYFVNYAGKIVSDINTYPEDIMEMNFLKLNEMIEEGLDNAEQKTRNSVEIINHHMNLIVKDHELVGKKTIKEVFPEEMLQHLEATEARRKWYFLRLIWKIIDGKIDELEEYLEKYWEIGGKYRRTAVAKLALDISINWLHKKENEEGFEIPYPWHVIEKNPELIDEYEIETVVSDMKKSRIAYGQIARNMQLLFDPNNGAIFAPAKERVEMIENEILDETNNYEIDQIGRRDIHRYGESIFIKFFKGKKSVSREMLLLTALFAKRHGVNVDNEYTVSDMLANSRYQSLDRKGYFDDFYFKVYEVMEEYKENIDIMDAVIELIAEGYEWEYIYTENMEVGVSIFREILLGGNVE